QAFYGNDHATVALNEVSSFVTDPGGSNGVAISPKNTIGKHALLLINPHTSFYFRSELQMSSDEGLNSYGAVTWGQFFIYQGFNEHCGWMHTSSYADVADVYEEAVSKSSDGYYYRYKGQLKILPEKQISLSVKSGNQTSAKTFPA